ncbi:hypothetical protein ACLSC7_000027 [Enterococcus hirae]
MPQTTNRQLTLKKKIGHAFVHQSTNTTLNTESHLKMILKDLPEDSLSIKESTDEQLYELPNSKTESLYVTVIGDRSPTPISNVRSTSESTCINDQDYSKRNTILDILKKTANSPEEVKELTSIIEQLINELPHREPSGEDLQPHEPKIKDSLVVLLNLLDNLPILNDSDKDRFIDHFDILHEEVLHNTNLQKNIPVTKEPDSLKNVREFISANRKKSPAELKNNAETKETENFIAFLLGAFHRTNSHFII